MNQSKVYIGLVNPKGPSNVGTIMRAAGCFNADKIYYTGTRYTRAAQFQTKLNTDTHKARHNIPLTGVEDLLAQKTDNMKVVCVELCVGATPLSQFNHPEEALYIFGPEDGSLSQALINQADHVVYIPTKDCLNLSATANVVLYDRLAKSLNNGCPSVFADKTEEEFIKASRDTNNRLQIKN